MANPTTDVHVHLAPPVTEEEAALVGLTWRDGRLARGDKPVGPPKLYDTAALRAWMSEAGIERSLVSVPPPFYFSDRDEETAAAWTAAMNRALMEACRNDDGLEPLVHLPLEHPSVAVAEARRLAGDVVGFAACAGVDAVSLASDELTALWEILEDTGRPLLLHPGLNREPRFEEFYLSNLLGNPVETAVAASQLLLGGVLQRHPGLKVVLVHCGGVLPAVVGRLQRGVDSQRPGVRPDTGNVVEAAGRFWSDCLAHDPASVRRADALFGTGHLLIGSDWPFPMGDMDPITTVAAILGADTADQLARSNAAALLTTENSS